jgi:hypothetical protein
MDHPTCGSGARRCAEADAIFDVLDMRVLEVEVDDERRLVPLQPHMLFSVRPDV